MLPAAEARETIEDLGATRSHRGKDLGRGPVPTTETGAQAGTGFQDEVENETSRHTAGALTLRPV